jgi:hypothetical protein
MTTAAALFLIVAIALGMVFGVSWFAIVLILVAVVYFGGIVAV